MGGGGFGGRERGGVRGAGRLWLFLALSTGASAGRVARSARSSSEELEEARAYSRQLSKQVGNDYKMKRKKTSFRVSLC